MLFNIKGINRGINQVVFFLNSLIFIAVKKSPIMEERIYLDFFKEKKDVAHIPEKGLYITRPRSFTIEKEKIGGCCGKLTTYEENGEYTLFIPVQEDYMQAYHVDKDLSKSPSLIRPWFETRCVAFYDIYDSVLESWKSCVGDRYKIMPLYYGDTLMEVIKYSWSHKIDNTRDWDKEFDTALFEIDSKDIKVLEAVCQSVKTYNYGLTWGILRWEKCKRDGYTVFKDGLSDELDMLLTGFEKRLVFYSFLFEEQKKHPKTLSKHFPDSCQSYSEENLIKLQSYYQIFCKYNWSIAKPSKVIDGESAIMGALGSGNGDVYGF